MDESGERTHAVVPLDEYERLKRAEERFESVRGFAMEMMISAMDQEENTEPHEESHDETHEDAEHDEGHHEERAWYQRS